MEVARADDLFSMSTGDKILELDKKAPPQPLENNVPLSLVVPSKQASAGSLHIELPRGRFRACWVLVLVLHGVCAAFYVMVAMVYHYLLSTVLIWTVIMYSLSIDVEEYPLVTAVHALLGAGHVLAVLKMIWMSLRQGELTFEAPPAITPRTASIPTSGGHVQKVKDGIQRVQNRLHRRRHFSSTDPVLVELRMNLRVVLDIALQSYQCYRMSWYLSRMWLLRMYTAMLVINCWTNPLIQFVINHTKCSRKLIEARIVVDVLLDVMTVILVPCVLLHTYYQQFDVLRRDFPRDFYYDDQTLMRFLNEFKLMLVYSGIDLVQRLALGGDLLFCLESLKKIVCPTPCASAVRPKTDSQRVKASYHVDGSAVPAPNGTTAACTSTKAATIINTITKAIFVTWGLIVACALIYAESKQTSQDCVLVVRPWFRPKPGCALIEISGGNFSASQDPRDAVAQRLASFDEVAVSYLILSHHSALHVPHNIQNLHNLVGLKMKNVTLIEWGDDAAITQTHHPRGLLSKDFPPLLLDIEVCVSTLSDLPANLPSVWPAGAWLFLDHSNFTSVPDVALEMDLAFLTFAFNHIHEVPAAMFTNPMLSLIDVSGNPIAALPNVSAESLTPLGLLVLDATDLVTLPPWMTENFLVNTEVYLGNTPYCNALGAANQTARTINDQPLCRLQDDCRRLHQIL